MSNAVMNSRLSTLPLDLLRDIVMNLTAEDALSLKNTYENELGFENIISECDSRLSVAKYLDKNLGNGAAWLTAMFHCLCYISGSRSLEFFVPGCTSTNSDWDIYVFGKTNAEKFMRMTQDLGVKWRSTLDDVQLCLLAGEGEVIMSSERCRRYLRTNTFKSMTIAAGHELVDPGWNIATTVTVIKIKNKKMTFEGSDDNNVYAASPILDITRGSIERNGRHVEIQLIRELRSYSVYSPDAIFEYHSSCVQSFLSPYLACHLYGKMAARKESYCRTSGVVNDDDYFSNFRSGHIPSSVGKFNKHWKKYEERGFKYRIAPDQELARYIGDYMCTFLPQTCPETLPSEAVQFCMKFIKSMEWSDSRHEDTKVVGYDKSLGGSFMQIEFWRGMIEVNDRQDGGISSLVDPVEQLQFNS